METAVALSVAILVVLVLLMSCWGAKPKRKSGNKQSASVNKQSDNANCAAGEISTWGQGVKNRELAKQYNDLMSMDGYDDYNSVIQYASLEPEVFDSHESYSGDIGVANSGASNLVVRSDPNDVNPWVGLRRPDYHSVYAGCDARVEHSEYPDEMTAATHYLL